MNDIAFSILWEELREEMMKADLYKKRLKMIEDGKKFRTLLKDRAIAEVLPSNKVFELKEQQDEHYKKTMFYSGLLTAMDKKEKDNE